MEAADAEEGEKPCVTGMETGEEEGGVALEGILKPMERGGVEGGVKEEDGGASASRG